MSKTTHWQLSVAVWGVVAVLVAANPSAALAVPGDVINLGTLGEESQGYSINNAGQVAGYSLVRITPRTASTRAFRYTGTPGSGGVMEDLGTLGGAHSYAYGINDLGQVAGHATIAGDRVFHAYRYTGAPGTVGVMHDLGTLGGGGSGGQAINNAGQVTGVSYLGGDFFLRTFRYTGNPGSGGVMENLGSLGGQNSFGNAINDAGQVAGFSDRRGNTGHSAFIYTGTPGAGGAMTNLGSTSNSAGEDSYGNAINSAGQVAGHVTVSQFFERHRATLYTTKLGALETSVRLGGKEDSQALGINEAGFIVGWAADRPFEQAPGLPRAALWQTDADHSFVDLDAWLDATNPTQGALWTLAKATDINDRGLVTGYGNYDDGPGGLSDGQRAFILDASSLVPEPGVAAMVALSGAVILFRRRRIEVRRDRHSKGRDL